MPYEETFTLSNRDPDRHGVSDLANVREFNALQRGNQIPVE
jgi:hypothetical protein